ncbi:MAG: nitroreductase, partial [Gammaproteobacteria bacterium]
HRLDRPQEVERLAQFVAEHAERDFSHREAWQETYRYIDFSGRRGQVEDVGFNIQQLMGPLPPWKRAWYRWALSPALMPISARLGMARKIAAQIGVLMAQSAALYYLEYSGPAADRREQELLAGGSMLALWLAATEKGLALHPVSVVLQHSEIQRRFQSLLGQAGEIWFFARVGEPVESSLAHFRYRRRVEDFLQ